MNQLKMKTKSEMNSKERIALPDVLNWTKVLNDLNETVIFIAYLKIFSWQSDSNCLARTQLSSFGRPITPNVMCNFSGLIKADRCCSVIVPIAEISACKIVNRMHQQSRICKN